MPNDPYDWADDESLSSDEVMRRFRALNPARATGPVARGVNYTVDFAGSAVAVLRPETGGAPAKREVSGEQTFDPKPHPLLTK